MSKACAAVSIVPVGVFPGTAFTGPTLPPFRSPGGRRASSISEVGARPRVDVLRDSRRAGEIVVPRCRALPELRLLEQRLERAAPSSDSKTKTASVGVRKTWCRSSPSASGSKGGPFASSSRTASCASQERQHDGDPPPAFCAELKRCEPLGDLGDDAGLRDARDRERVAGARLEHEARAAVDPLGRRAADADLREVVVGDLAAGRLRAGHAVEPDRPRQQLELAARQRLVPFPPDDSVTRSHQSTTTVSLGRCLRRSSSCRSCRDSPRRASS